MQGRKSSTKAVLAAVLISTVLYTTSVAGLRQQAYAVKGKLRCGDLPVGNVNVKLFDEDVAKDELLEQGYTDTSGGFLLQGTTSELTDIDPVLKIYHECDDELEPGVRKVILRLPKSYITSGTTAEKVFDAGVLNLEMKFSDEGRDIISSKRRRSVTRRFGPYYFDDME